MRHIQPTELKRLLDETQSRPLLLDVREPFEYSHCRIEGSLHIPMHDVPARIGELDPNREIVVICHHGVRSHSVAEYLERQNFTRVSNLLGGVEAWALQVEPAMPRY